MTGRDRFLDYLRGSAIIWIILVHTFYLKDFFPYTVEKSYILFEMPVLFFVSGAALYGSHQRHSAIGRFVTRRLSRLLVPYALLAVVCLSLYYALTIADGKAISWRQAADWLVLYPRDTVPVYVGEYTWFVRAMVFVSLAHLGLVRLFDRPRWRWLTAGALVALVVLVPLYNGPGHTHVGFVQTTAFYSFFVYVGYAYSAKQLPSRLIPYLASTALAALALAAVVHLGVYSGDLQADKFPPNLAYGLFGVAWLSVFLALRARILAWVDQSGPVRRVIQYYNDHSYALYLWEGFGFWAVDGIITAMGLGGWLHQVHYVLPMVIYFVLTVALTAPIAWLADTLSDGSSSSVGAGVRKLVSPRKVLSSP